MDAPGPRRPHHLFASLEFLDQNTHAHFEAGRLRCNLGDGAGDPGPCARGGPRRAVTVRVEDVESASLLEEGVEHITLPLEVWPSLERLRVEGLRGSEGPEAALRNGPLRLAASLLGMHRSPAAQEEEEAESAVLRQLQGIGTLPLLKAFVTVPLKCSGAILRRTGPDRTSPLDRDPDGARSHRRPATTAHIDQDVEGEPLRAMGVSQLFRSLPWLRLLNVWVPLTDGAPVRPLAVLDARSTNRATEHVSYRAEYGGLERKTDLFLLGHARTQRWLYASRLQFGDALVFDTLASAHTSFALPLEPSLAVLRSPLIGALRWLETATSANSSAAGSSLLAGDATATPSDISRACADEELTRRAEQRLAERGREGAIDGEAAAHLWSLLAESAVLLRQACEAWRRVRAEGEMGVREAEAMSLAGSVRSLLGRSERTSLEVRCAAIVMREEDALVAGTTAAAAMLSFLWWRRRRRAQRQPS